MNSSSLCHVHVLIGFRGLGRIQISISAPKRRASKENGFVIRRTTMYRDKRMAGGVGESKFNAEKDPESFRR